MPHWTHVSQSTYVSNTTLSPHSYFLYKNYRHSTLCLHLICSNICYCDQLLFYTWPSWVIGWPSDWTGSSVPPAVSSVVIYLWRSVEPNSKSRPKFRSKDIVPFFITISQLCTARDLTVEPFKVIINDLCWPWVCLLRFLFVLAVARYTILKFLGPCIFIYWRSFIHVFTQLRQ